MQIKISLIDIDGMFYHSHRETSLEESIEAFKDKLNNCLTKTECTHWAGFTSKGKTFRNQIFDKYKANRTQTPPKYLAALKEWAISEYNLTVCKGYEADDGVAYWYNQDICIDDNGTHFEPRHIFESALDMCKSDGFPTFTFESVEKVLCSPDKDLLLSIPGKHFNYSYKLEVKNEPSSVIKGWWVETSETDARYFKAKQLLMGDSTDGIKCLNKVGDVKSGKILEDIHPKQYFSGILEEYIKEFGISQGIYKFQKNYRLLHMLDCDSDFMREVDNLPMTPIFTEVIRDSQIESNNEFNVEF